MQSGEFFVSPISSFGVPHQGEEPATQCLYKNAFIKKNENSWKMIKKMTILCKLEAMDQWIYLL